MNPEALPEFLRKPRFWFSLLNAAILFAPRFGVVLKQEEIASLNLILAAVFDIVPPVNMFVAMKRYQLAARTTPIPLVERQTRLVDKVEVIDE